MGRYAVAILAVAVLSCGEAIDPAPPSWQTLATLRVYFETDIMKVAVDGNAAYFPYWITSENYNGGIKKYQDGVLTDAYVPELKGADYAGVTNIAIGPKSGWAVATRRYTRASTLGGENAPVLFLVKYENGRWAGENEFPVDLGSDDFPLGIVPKDSDSCYLLGSGDSVRVPRKLYKFENGVVNVIPGVEANAFAYDAATKTTYALAGRADRIDVMVSADGGASWTSETVVAEAPVNTFNTGYVYAAVGGAGVLYFCGRTKDPGGTAVYRRTGAAGAGRYELCGYYPLGPYAGMEAYGLAVDGRGHVVIVGRKTSICYDGVEWREEELPNKNDFYAVAGGDAGFYAVAINGMGNADTQLLFHP
jgi:hypothetical protein